jgi:carbonic anhydrase
MAMKKVRPRPPRRPRPCPKDGKPYDAMVLSCIDPRIINQVLYYMNVERKQSCRYSQFTIAGAAVAVVADAFKGWRETFWQNLASSIKLHGITRVIAIDHRDCGAAKIAYGEDCCKDPAKETEIHKRAMEEFRAEVKKREPKIKEVVIGLMDLNGKIELF